MDPVTVFPILQQRLIPHPADIIKNITHEDIAGTKVVFIVMPLRESAVPTDLPEGVLLLATNLIKNYGVEATIIDLNAYRIKDALAEKTGKMPNGRYLTEQEAEELICLHFKKYGTPTIIGLSGIITSLDWEEKTAKIVRRLAPDAFLVSGNGLATEFKTGLFKYIPELDGIAHSEGDDVIVKIVYDGKIIKEKGFENALNSGKLAPYYLGFEDGRHRFRYDGNRPRNLDVLPFADLSLLKEAVYGNPILSWYLGTPLWSGNANNSSATPWKDTQYVPCGNSVVTRGCPYTCKYCYRGQQGETQWSYRSAEHVLAEIEHNVLNYGIKFWGFHDDNIAVREEIIRGLMILQSTGVKFGSHYRLDEASGLHKDPSGKLYFESPLRVEMMAKAGFVYAGMGPESASPKSLETLGKGGHTLSNGFVTRRVDGKEEEFAASMIHGIENNERFGIHSNCTWIKGTPAETIEDIKKTVRFMQWQMELYRKSGKSTDSVNQKMFTLTWYPGVALINYPRVRDMLSKVFNLKFVKIPRNSGGVEYEPVFDKAFHIYTKQLDDATKVLSNPQTGEPLHFSNMTTKEFIKVGDLIDSNRTLDILDL